jgi:hypothetical protein
MCGVTRLRNSARFAVAVAGLGLIARRWLLQWHATTDEIAATLPGDELLAHADLTATRAITIEASPSDVWPWIAQMGQGRGGLYSYDGLENLAGLDMHSADRVVDTWQHVEVGDPFRLHPDVALEVARVEPGRALVVQGAGSMARHPPFDFTWAFVLSGAHDRTRLVIRERYAYAGWWVRLLVEPIAVVSFVMSEKMLRGVRDRVEQTTQRRPDR